MSPVDSRSTPVRSRHPHLRGGEPTPAEGGGEQGPHGKSLHPRLLESERVANAWKQWGVKTRPANYNAALRDRYGLHPAPYPNGDLPMGCARPLSCSGRPSARIACSATAVRFWARATLAWATALLTFRPSSRNWRRRAGNPASYRSRSRMSAAPTRRMVRRLPARLSRSRPESSRMEGPRPPRRHLLRRAGLVAPEEEEDHLPHRRHQFAERPDADAVHDAPAHDGEGLRQGRAAFRDIQQYLLNLEPPKYPFAIDEPRPRRARRSSRRTARSATALMAKNGPTPTR